MSVYVDSAFIKYGRMRMCHMMADSTLELVTMANSLGLQQRWIQKLNTPHEHFDICKSKRALVIQLGAIEVTNRELVHLIQARRERLKDVAI